MLELFILGKLKDGRTDNSKDPSGRKTQKLEWVDIDKLPEITVYPKTLSKKLRQDYQKGFPIQGEYIGVIE